MILGICENVDVLKVMNIVVTIIKIIQIVVPIVLMFSLMFKAISAMTKQDDDAIANLKKKAVPNIIAAAVIFIVPLLVGIIMNVTLPDSEYTKCIVGISSEKIQEAYEDKAERLVSKAENTLNINDYVNAMNYMPNVKDKDKRKGYEERLEAVKKQIDEGRTGSLASVYDKVRFSEFKWTYYSAKSGPATSYYSAINPYFVWAPEDASALNGVSLPLIVWLHGAGEIVGKISGNGMLNTSFFKTVSEMQSQYDLKPVPAIIVAPQSYANPDEGGWNIKSGHQSVSALIEYAKNTYNIDESKIVIMGHSMGGYGARLISAQHQDTYYGVVIMSAYPRASNDVDYFASSSLKVWGYSEAEDCKGFFDSIGKPDNFTLYKGVRHGDVPMRALVEDNNKDGVSDLMHWLFGDVKIKESNRPIEKRFFIGDSRTVGMAFAVNGSGHFSSSDVENGTATVGMDTWSAKSAEAFIWMKNTGIPNIENKLDDTSALIILMGVNNMISKEDAEEYIKRYTDYYNEKIPQWNERGIRVYFAALMPCSGKHAFRNTYIEKFNNKMQEIENLNYIDTYNFVKDNGITLPDGLHYSSSGNKKIYEYIIENLE